MKTSQRRHRFVVYLSQIRYFQTYILMEIIRDTSRTKLFRLAALRTLVCASPIEITQGRPYIERKKLVRTHYQI